MATPHRSDDLIADAREAVKDRFFGPTHQAQVMLALADALEATEAERDAALAVIERAREAVKYGSRMDANPTRLGGPPECMEGDRWWQSWHLQADAAWRKNMTEALSSVPAEVLRERDRRVRAEAVKEFRVNDLRDRAERADERWKGWGDVYDAVLRDRLFQRAAAIEQNSEGNET